MALFRVEHCWNGRTHIYAGRVKFFSWGRRAIKPFKNPKLGVSYSVWDGEELLEQSIKQIRSVVDYVNVVWQKVSWYGKPCNPDLEDLLLRLKSDGLIDELIFFDPDLSINPSYNEVNKRNIGLRAARRAGCTHFMTMDTDEFYDTEQFQKAYDDIVLRNLSHTACNILTYISPDLRKRDPENFFVSFICKINRKEKFRLSCLRNGVPVLLDPTRQIPIKNSSRICMLGDIVMHHMKGVRKDIMKKIDNSSMAQTPHGRQQLYDEMILKQDEYIRVKNQFRIKV